jgi:hypothetical protein
LARRIGNKLGISKRILKIKFLFERLSRHFNSGNTGVFFGYKYEFPDIHPTFKKRCYTYAPLQYVNYSRARLYHWIHHPVKSDKPFILEPNDHPLAPACRVEPWENIGKVEEVAEKYLNCLCKKIIVESPGQMDLFKYYYGNKGTIIDKCIITSGGLIPNKVNWDKKLKRIMKGEFNYVCLASDFTRKGVDIIIEAWSRFYKYKRNSKLYLACPNVPEKYNDIIKNSNIILIKKAPLSESDKTKLHALSDVALAPLHTDGGANINEAFENGLTVITMRNQRSQGYSLNNNCIVIDVPFYYYDPQHWGVTWKTANDFFSILGQAKKKGDFEGVIQGFVNSFEEFNENPDLVYDLCVRSYDYACSDYSIWKRNAKHVKIYNDILSGNV